MKEEGWSEDEYVEENYEVEFHKEAEHQMDNDIGKIIFPSEFDIYFNDYESEFDD